MRRRTALLLTATAACCALAAGPVAAPAGAATMPAGHWGNARQLPGLSTLNTSGETALESMSCAAPGNCVAVGSYGGIVSPHAFYAEEKGGVWGKAKPVFTGGITSDLVSVSCSDAADCVAVGYYTPHLTGFPDELPLVLNKVNGTWEFTSEPLPAGAGDSHAMSVSCPPQSPENCTMGGWFNDAKGVTQPFTADEHDGIWGPERLPGALQLANVGPDTTVSSVSCASPGNCSAVGHYTAVGSNLRSFVMDEFSGAWTLAHPIPQLDTLTMSQSRADTVSCATPGNCALAGEYWDSHGTPQAFVIDEVNGDWIKPRPVPGIAGPAVSAQSSVGAVSCAAPGSCVVAGSFTADTRNGTIDGFAAEEKNGAWQPAIKIAGSKASVEGIAGAADSVACAGAGSCAVGGSISDGTGVHPVVLDETSGTWGTPHQLPVPGEVSGDQFAGVFAISCASPGNCAAAWDYEDKTSGQRAFAADESPATTTTLKLSAARVKFGHEQSERLSVKVKPRTGGTPTGKVTVAAGSKTLCTIKLANGKGSCTLAAKRLKPGKYRLTGTYGGDRKYAGSSYPAASLTVVK